MVGTSINKERAGKYLMQLAGYKAFVPKSLPPDPQVKIDTEMLHLIANANQALGRLDGAAHMLPDPDLFVQMYMRKEAVLSSEIEGTQASLTDLLEYESSGILRSRHPTVIEVFNYVRAMNYGLERLESLPLSNRLLKEIHGVLLANARGSDKQPGEFRTIQNWIGAPGSDISTAMYVPPPVTEMNQAMQDLEIFMHNDKTYPNLVKMGLIHAQFETIHPFLDGNGRMGRLLITFFLCHECTLARPLLYLSAFLREHQSEYYDKLQAIRDTGNWEEWLKFFLVAVHQVSIEACDKAKNILELRERHRNEVQKVMPGTVKGLELLDLLFHWPVMSIPRAAEYIGVSYPTASALIKQFESLKLINEVTGQGRNREYIYRPYLDLLDTR